MSSRSKNQKILANMVLHNKQTNNDKARLNTLYRGLVKMYENVNKERKFTDRSKVQKELTNIRKKMREVENDMKKLKEKKMFIGSELKKLHEEIPRRNKKYANSIAALKKSNYIKKTTSTALKKEFGMNKNNKK
tara:strand:+ start:3392 stop:3793 length:402 start_codon:yes stop_codon:yes gene_type:complete